MPHLVAIFACLKKSLDFKGRAGRTEFWSFVGFWLIVAVLSALAFHLPKGVVTPDWCLRALAAAPVLLIPALLLVPLCAVAVRRLHDVGLSGWWLLTATAPVPLLDLLVIGAQIAFLAKKGTAGENRYGPDPRLRARGDMQPAFDGGTL